MKEKIKISPFIILAIFYIISIFIFRIIEFCFIGEVKSFSGFIYGNLIPTLFVSISISIIYLLISFFSKKAASFTAALLFSLLFISEIGLAIYNKSTGMLMGKEMILRPLWETCVTIKSSINIWITIAVVILISAFIYFSLLLSRKKINKIVVGITLLLMAISAPLFFIIKPNQDNYIVNKTWYCLYACFIEKDQNECTLSKIEFDEDKIKNYRNIFPEREISDCQYPLERTDNINNVLGSFFKVQNTKPNIVVIVVESLGADIFGINDYGYTFTPFLDSLSKHSLLWTNCLSTTPRSFGAVPAITGSVPHGLKGFQFGNIPEYNSLFSVLKDNDYETSAFYAGEYSFDKVYDYLVSQKVDFLAPLLEDQQKKENRHYDYTYWGYHDKPMFKKSMDMIEQRDDDKAYFDLFITISQHDNYLRLQSKTITESYYNKAKEIIATLPAEEQKKKNEILGHLAATIYTDDAIKYFIERYQQHDKENTIFVITGDHSLNQNPTNPLDAFHVPLIIWSPMLEKSARFNSVVSHNDIVPSLNALLRDNYNLQTPGNIHWMGGELDTINDFHCNLKTCFLRYTRNIFDGIYEKYYYTTANYKKRLFLIKENIELEEINDIDLINDISNKFETLIYVDYYSYTNNKVTKNALFPHNKFKNIKSYSVDSVFCASSMEKPSISKSDSTLISSQIIKGNYKEIKLIVTADLMYTGKVWQDNFINFVVDYTCDKDGKITHCDNINKNITSKNYQPNQWVKMEFVKILSTKDSKKHILDIYLKPTNKDYLWNPDHTVTLKNININILGSR